MAGALNCSDALNGDGRRQTTSQSVRNPAVSTSLPEGSRSKVVVAVTIAQFTLWFATTCIKLSAAAEC